MLSHRILVDAPELRVAEVRCPGHGPRWSAPEPIGRFAIVLPRRGVFVRRVAGVEALVDPATGYVQQPGTEQEVAHPAGGDVCTSITLPGLAAEEAPAAGVVHVTPRLGLAHRLLVVRARAGADPVELVDLATEVASAVLAGPPPAAARSHRRLVDAVREILAAEPGCPLPRLAHRLMVSPSHLSRVFHQVTGATLRRYRLRLRTAAALELLATGHHSLAAVAAEVGFSDQAHLARTLRSELAQTPRRLRILLEPSQEIF